MAVELSKKSELKENLLASRIERVLKWIADHRTLSLVILSGIVLTSLVSSVFIIRQRELTELNWTRLSQARHFLSQNQFDQSRQIFTEITSTSGNKPVGTHASYYLGEQSIQQKNFDAAIETYNQMLSQSEKSPFRPLILTNLAYIYEEKNDFTSASQTYQQFMSQYAEHFLAPRNQLKLGETQARAGDWEAARNSLGTLIDLYPSSKWAENARQMLDKFKSG